MRIHGALFALLALGAALALPSTSQAADLSLSPSTITMPADKSFSMSVMVDPGSDKINASDGNIIFDKDVLTVVSISKDGSVFSLWTADPSYSNSDGTIVYSGGSPSGTNKKGTILTITFKGKQPGTAKVSFTKGSVLAADGKGTDVFKNSSDATVTITEAAAEEPADTSSEIDTGGANGPTPLAPVITSATHPKEENWYATSTAQFDWALPADATAERSLLSDSDASEPEQLLAMKDLATSTVLTGLREGVSYFYLQFRNDSGWGIMTKRKIQIDTIAPADFDIALLDQGANADAPKLKFSTTDEGSGVDRYEIAIGGTTVATVKDSELTDGAYPVPPQDGGPQKVSIKAFDKAGNSKEAAKDLTLPKVEKPTPKGEEAPVAQGGWTFERILTILFALAIGALFAWNWSLRTNGQKSKTKLLRRVAEAADKNDRVFSAMREEFEQMVNDFDVKPQLTPEERAFLENIKEVLDISEEVLDSAMDELKKTVREL